jgi:hypothetical protein
LLYISNLILAIDINLSVLIGLVHIYVNSIILGSHNENVLTIVWQEKLWLPFQGRLKLPFCCLFLSYEIENENLVDFGKNDAVPVEAFLVLEMEVHGYLCEVWNVFEHHSDFGKYELVTIIFVNEKLICFLFVHY